MLFINRRDLEVVKHALLAADLRETKGMRFGLTFTDDMVEAAALLGLSALASLSMSRPDSVHPNDMQIIDGSTLAPFYDPPKF